MDGYDYLKLLAKLFKEMFKNNDVDIQGVPKNMRLRRRLGDF